MLRHLSRSKEHDCCPLLSAKHSGSVLHVIPKAFAFTMTDREMKDFIHVRLGLGFRQEDGAQHACSACGWIFGDESVHIEHAALTCQKMKKTTQLLRHNAIENQTAKSLKDVAFFVAHSPKMEPDLEFCVSEKRNARHCSKFPSHIPALHRICPKITLTCIQW